MNDIELMPCPFCGGKAETRDCFYCLDNAVLIRCSKCFVKTEKILIDHPSYTIDGLDESTRYTREQAIEKASKIWNRRTNKMKTEVIFVIAKKKNGKLIIKIDDVKKQLNKLSERTKECVLPRS